MMLPRPRPHHYLASLSILILTLFLLHNQNIEQQTHHVYSVHSSRPRQNSNPRPSFASAALARWRAASKGDDIHRVDLSFLRLKKSAVFGDVDGEEEREVEDKRVWMQWRKEFASRVKGLGEGIKMGAGKAGGEEKKNKVGGTAWGRGGRPRVSREEADRAFCGMSPCKVVVPSFIASHDESSAQQNIQELSVFSSLLDRRLILPNVQKSHIGMCGAEGDGQPWETYYDIEALGPTGHKKGSLTQAKFEQWLATRPEPPRVQRVVIASLPDSPSSGFVGVDFEDRQHHHQHDCILEKARGNVRLDGWEDALVLSENSSSISDEWDEQDPPLSDQIVQMLGNSSAFEIFDSEYPVPTGTTPDILLVTWLSEDPLFATTPALSRESQPVVGSPFAYAPDVALPPGRVALPPAAQLTMPLAFAPGLVNLARRISDPIQPFLSVHWRTEGVPAGMLPTCSRALLDKMESVMASSVGSGIRTVYLATDLPLQADDLFRSSAYNPAAEPVEDDESTASREEAVKLIKMAFGRWGMLGRWGVRLTGLREEMWVRGVGEKEKSLAGMDSGVAGILDKLVSSHAEMFLSADEPCGLSSSFTNHIIALRNRTLSLSSLSDDDATPSRLRNLVDQFGSEAELVRDGAVGSEMTEVQWILD